MPPWQTVCTALNQATSDLRTATVATHGGFVQKALAHLAPADVAAKAALAKAGLGSVGGTPPVVTNPSLDAALAKLNAIHQPGNSQRSMHATLNGLKSAFVALKGVADADLSGARDPIIAAIAQTADETAAFEASFFQLRRH